MSLVARNNLFHIDRFFNDAVRRGDSPGAASDFTPRVDIFDAGDHYEISAELPGVAKEAIQVHVKEGVLTLEAESEQRNPSEAASGDDGRTVLRRERRYGKYARSFNFGADVDAAAISASFCDGVLALIVPKAIEQEPERTRIEIS